MFRKRFGLDFSHGEYAFAAALVGVALVSAILTSVIAARLLPTADFVTGYRGYGLWSMMAGFIGGFIAFLGCYERWWGFPGRMGLLRALIGTALICFFSAVIGGTLVLPFYGTMFGVFQMIIAIIETPILALVIATAGLGGHQLIKTWRNERDSIFGAQIQSL